VNHFASKITSGGYRMEEVASALQKCLRRGRADDALFWATELDLSGYGEYVWKRLRIIASEDVGPSAPLVAVQIRALYQNWLDLRRKDDQVHAPERLFLVDAVLRLSRACKNRQVDNALVVFYEGPRPQREIPDFALDRHTMRGRQRGRGWRHFFDEGARLEGEHQPAAADPYAARAREIRRDAGTQAELPAAE
jgi:replication-associated recombination protein RarA